MENASALLFAARRLTAALAGWLTARQSGVREFVLHLAHRQSETRIGDLSFAEPTADGERFERVLRERLERLELVAPVETLRLAATHIAPLAGQSGRFFVTCPTHRMALVPYSNASPHASAKRECAVSELRADHRPECATRSSPLSGLANDSSSNPSGGTPTLASQTTPPRPLWLLDPPEALREVDGRPWRQGPLHLLNGPERIESGWWDGGESAVGDIRRDYYIARAPDDGWLWIFRDVRTPGGWFLHGYFS